MIANSFLSVCHISLILQNITEIVRLCVHAKTKVLKRASISALYYSMHTLLILRIQLLGISTSSHYFIANKF